MAGEEKLYHYKAHVTSVYDGDTFRADVDMGLMIWRRDMKFRLLGIDTPELRGDEYDAGIVARDRTRELIDDKDIIIETHKSGKYGRWLAKVYLYDQNYVVNYDTTLNEILLNEGLAKVYEG